MDELKRIAKEHQLIIIDDAAHACGAEYKGKKIGGNGFSDLTCFSFHAVKNLATGDGGMVTTDNEEFAKRIKRMNWVGMTKDTYERSIHGFSWDYDILDYGFKYHMNDITAAIGIVQLKKLDMMNQKRREIIEKYNEAFKKLTWISKIRIKDDVLISGHHYCIKINNGKRNDLYNHLKEKGISSSVHYKPVYLFTIFQSNPFFRSVYLPQTDDAWKRTLLLPVYPDMTEQDIQRVTEGVVSFENKIPEKTQDNKWVTEPFIYSSKY
jgi:perosamine synthetase